MSIARRRPARAGSCAARPAQPHRLRHERHRPEQTTLYRLVQQHAASFVAHTETSTGAELPRFIRDEFDAFLECGILAHGFLRLRCGECGHDKLLAFSCKRRGFCPSCGARRMSQTAAHLVDHVVPHVPVRQWVLSLPIPLRVLLAAQPELVTPVLQVVQRVVERHLLDHTGLKSDEGQGGAVTLIQRFGSAANLNIHLHCLVLDGVYRCDGDGAPSFVEAGAPTDEELHALLQTVIARLMRMLTRRGVLVEDMGQTWLAEPDSGSEEARTLRPLQAAAATYRIAFGPRAGQKVLTVQGAVPRGLTSSSRCAPTSAVSARTLPCAAAPMTARHWNNCAATSPARRWPTSCAAAAAPDRGSSARAALEDVLEIGPPIVPVALGRFDQAQQDSGALAGQLRPHEWPMPSSDSRRGTEVGGNLRRQYAKVSRAP